MGVTLAVNPRSKSLKDVQKELGMHEGFDVGLEMSGNPSAFHDMLANMSHGDAGFVVVDVRDYSWTAFGGYLAAGTRRAV